MIVDRRNLIGAASAALLVSSNAHADTPPDALFSAGVLASNPLARMFRVVPRDLSAPRTPLLGEEHLHTLHELRGKTYLVTLWAEWCAPCIFEMADFATLNLHHESRDFGVIAILTGSEKKLDYKRADDLLRSKNAHLPLWVEPNGGSSLLDQLAVRPGVGKTLPCNLLVNAAGHIRGRSFGSSAIGMKMKDGRLSETDKVKLLSSNLHSAWATRDADVFVNALAGGVLS